MIDPVDRHTAIEKLKRRKKFFCKNRIEFGLLPENDKSRVDEIDACIEMLMNLPSAQPDVPDTNVGDMISRQAAIDFIDAGHLVNPNEPRWSDNEVVSFLKSRPSAQPEQHWTPCSERLPDEHEWPGTKKFGTTISNEVYVTFEAPDGQRFAEHINFQNGKLSPVDEQRMKVWFKGAKPIAWMPLPEPYQAERREVTD